MAFTAGPVSVGECFGSGALGSTLALSHWLLATPPWCGWVGGVQEISGNVRVGCSAAEIALAAGGGGCIERPLDLRNYPP